MRISSLWLVHTMVISSRAINEYAPDELRDHQVCLARNSYFVLPRGKTPIGQYQAVICGDSCVWASSVFARIPLDSGT